MYLELKGERGNLVITLYSMHKHNTHTKIQPQQTPLWLQDWWHICKGTFPLWDLNPKGQHNRPFSPALKCRLGFSRSACQVIYKCCSCIACLLVLMRIVFHGHFGSQSPISMCFQSFQVSEFIQFYRYIKQLP